MCGFFKITYSVSIFVCSVPRPELSGQCVLGHHPPGPVQALVLQGELFHVQEDGAPEAARKVRRSCPPKFSLRTIKRAQNLAFPQL